MYSYIEWGNGSGFNVFAIKDAAQDWVSDNWEEYLSYYFTGLEYRMLLCPFFFATDELLLQRPALYFKNEISYAGIVFYPKKPDIYGTNDFFDNLSWMV